MSERVVEVRLTGGLRAEGTIGKHTVVLDEPEDLGGTDDGMTPVQAFLASLGGCSAITMRMVAQRKGWPLDDVKVTVRLTRPDPGQKGTPRLVQEIELVGDLDDEQRERLRDIAGRCPVHKLLDGPLETEETLV